MDQAVLKTQQWLNKNYLGKNGYIQVSEDGATGWGTMKGLISALQIELGISSPNGNFGPATATAFKGLSASSTQTNQIYILQGALYCKGYDPLGFTGKFTTGTQSAIRALQSDAGLTTVDGIVNSVLMKSLLSMDAFKLLNYGEYHGDAKIRTIQQNLNRDYSSNQYFAKDIGLVPCDGIYGRSTNKALLYGLQIEEGITGKTGGVIGADGNLVIPNGFFGSTTKDKCPIIPNGTTNPKFIYLLQYALYCNGFDSNGFNGHFGDGTIKAVNDFQAFACLGVDGTAGQKTWASLLVSTGDPSRKGTACDCSTTLTPAKVNTLVKNGYKYVGRYLTGSYAMTVSELEVIYSAGLSVFPIFEYGNKLSYFNKQQGIADGKAAYTAADNLGFKLGSLIYFCVDFDAVDEDVTKAIIPYFKGIQEAFSVLGNPYGIGVYGPRNACKRIAKEGISLSSFVCDMSTGFSGNLGYSLPGDWTVDQISTIKLGSGDGYIEIDNDIFSGKNYNPAINSADWRTDAINRGWGPITIEEYFKRMGTVLQNSISNSVTTLLNNTNDSSSFDWTPGKSDYVSLANALINNTTYSIWIGDIRYDTTKTGSMRVYKKVNAQGTLKKIDEYKLKKFSDVGKRFEKGTSSALKLEFLKKVNGLIIDRIAAIGGTLVGTISDMIDLEEKGYVHSNRDWAIAFGTCLVQNGLVTWAAAIFGASISAIIAPEFPIVGSLVGGAATAIFGYAVSKLLGAAELEQFITNKIEWILNQLF
ncbi:DUF1906 domain-containing protein [Clostridium sp. SHJSY1]|uniref:glycoside hydrolase domain-containing protein n=1 Tax=Clostridium sp. SHJSY1 TaxID=2942483 RepID=UPI002876D894|nr:glycoside hydrolase domain-containing protein [Clostridium sp. SHJSY1]MDS0527255.1 DUF1906 domain-containing protein [Clostridium sp. SHJSY1]